VTPRASSRAAPYICYNISRRSHRLVSGPLAKDHTGSPTVTQAPLLPRRQTHAICAKAHLSRAFHPRPWHRRLSRRRPLEPLRCPQQRPAPSERGERCSFGRHKRARSGLQQHQRAGLRQRRGRNSDRGQLGKGAGCASTIMGNITARLAPANRRRNLRVARRCAAKGADMKNAFQLRDQSGEGDGRARRL
jgi:hypothetical protein